MEDKDRVNIRIAKRLPVGTILHWSTELLSPEQQAKFEVRIKFMTSAQWVTPHITTADNMGFVKGINSDAIMILHDEELTQDTPFMAKLVFGVTEFREASVKIAGRISHMPFLKPIRTADGTYALPTCIVNVDEIVERVVNRLKEIK